MKDEPLPDTIKEHKHQQVKDIGFGAVIISTTRYKEKQNDDSSTDRTVEVIEVLVKEKGYKLVKTEFIPDDPVSIRLIVDAMLKNENIDVIITSGGTGISPRDKTIDALAIKDIPVLPGFGEIFRYLSYKEVGIPAMLSRSEAFFTNQKCIFCLPGSPKAVMLAIKSIILPEIVHILSQLRKSE